MNCFFKTLKKRNIYFKHLLEDFMLNELFYFWLFLLKGTKIWSAGATDELMKGWRRADEELMKSDAATGGDATQEVQTRRGGRFRGIRFRMKSRSAQLLFLVQERSDHRQIYILDGKITLKILLKKHRNCSQFRRPIKAAAPGPHVVLHD